MKYIFLFILSLLLLSSESSAEVIEVANFQAGDLAGWEEKEFKGKTDYKIQNLDGLKVLTAKSSSSASGMFREITVDLEKTPYLNWSWKVDNVFENINERTKVGDDYPARVYVIVSGGAFFWRTKALNYVWSSNQEVGSSWPNAFTSKAVMMAVQSGPEKVGKWVRQKRNIREDFKRYFGKDIKELDAVAIMTDTDNAGGQATAHYGNIYFSSE